MRMQRTLERRRQRLWVVRVESSAMIADGLSRGDRCADQPVEVDEDVLRPLRLSAVEVAWSTATTAGEAKTAGPTCSDLSKETGHVGARSDEASGQCTFKQ